MKHTEEPWSKGDTFIDWFCGCFWCEWVWAMSEYSPNGSKIYPKHAPHHI